MLELLRLGGSPMYVMVLLSIIGLTIIIERAVFFMKLKGHQIEKYKDEILDSVKEKKFDQAISICEGKKSPVFWILQRLISHHRNSNVKLNTEHLDDLVKELILESELKLEKNMWLLSISAYISPLAGLLGTVIGMISAFSVIAIEGVGNPTILAEGISQALITTATGLIIAIPSIIFLNAYNKKIEITLVMMEKLSTKLINIFRIQEEIDEKNK